ncbi:Acetyltransferase involved in cellulose biosynthesis, CelD/BcsL family [Devosia lucknowensis]|uniref:Acetyltransferase involved in cellulose biosynthesis, CelD/BcsL family n=1 Tax=Devosia lucknowensis TaxID=1096929 RepID=A0A1Y6G7I4_9HYPH|nr:GNAT family N-acetyltransferase [Devosia lucknowensis]SMQ86075.1 Acetyltransferase involved in cellulose biosynthesis, CelD/BcsL family [Devosia lucknowensis]
MITDTRPETRPSAGDQSSAIVVARLDAAQLAALPAAQWDLLTRNSLTENPFFDRRQVLASLATVDKGKKVGALSFSVGGALVGLFLFQSRSKIPAPFPVANGLANDYLLNGTPLIDRDHADAVIEKFLDLVRTGGAPAIWAFDDVDLDAAVFQKLRAAVAATGMAWATATPYQRAYLTRLDGGLEEHLTQVLSKNRLKDVRRTMRRLGEAGHIALEHVEDEARLPGRIDDFLTLENAGWKGEMGTSFLSRPADAEFARCSYVAGLAAMDSLLLDGRPIAMKLSIRTQRTAFTPKIAYDETYKKLGPGMALEYMLIEDFYANDTIDAVDAAATAEGHSALNFFNNHKSMATVILGCRSWQVRLLAWLHDGRETLKKKVLEFRARQAERRHAAPKPDVET